MVTSTFDKNAALRLLSAIADPEIPVVSIEEMGMLRDVVITEQGCEVIITPTYTACPAMSIIAQDIKATLEKHGYNNVMVSTVYSPAWTTDWISEETKAKLRNYGIAAPGHSSCLKGRDGNDIVECPRCFSTRTTLISQFGSTACKALYKCDVCLEPFDYFKCH